MRLSSLDHRSTSVRSRILFYLNSRKAGTGFKDVQTKSSTFRGTHSNGPVFGPNTFLLLARRSVDSAAAVVQCGSLFYRGSSASRIGIVVRPCTLNLASQVLRPNFFICNFKVPSRNFRQIMQADRFNQTTSHSFKLKASSKTSRFYLFAE